MRKYGLLVKAAYPRWFALHCLLLNMRISACFFLRLTNNKIRTRQYGMRIFQAFIKFFLQCDVTRLLRVVIMVLAIETFTVGSVLTKIKTSIFTQI